MTPSVRRRVSQAKARTRSETQNGTSTKAVTQRRCRGPAWTIT